MSAAQSGRKHTCVDELDRLRELGLFAPKRIESHRRDGIASVSNLHELPSEQTLPTPHLEDALPRQKMNQMPKRVCTPTQAIRRNTVSSRKVFVTSFLAHRRDLRKGLT